MNIFRHEMRMHRNSILIWSFAFCAVMGLFMGLYPTIEKNVDNFQKLLSQFPPEFLAAFSIELITFGTPLGFFAFIFVYAALIAGIQGMRYGLSILSIEEREKTADFLLSKPISRTRIFTGKVSAVISSLFLTHAVFFVISWITVRTLSNGNFDGALFVKVTVTLLYTQLIFMCIGLAVSMIPRKIKAVTPISMGVVFGFFVIQLFASAFEDVQLTYLTPFKFFDAEAIVRTGQYSLPHVLLAIALVVVTFTLSYLRYVRKDMAQI